MRVFLDKGLLNSPLTLGEFVFRNVPEGKDLLPMPSMNYAEQKISAGFVKVNGLFAKDPNVDISTLVVLGKDGDSFAGVLDIVCIDIKKRPVFYRKFVFL